jgi:hypothetical protein
VLDFNLKHTDIAEQHLIAGIDNSITNHGRYPVAPLEHPDRSAGIQQKPHMSLAALEKRLDSGVGIVEVVRQVKFAPGQPEWPTAFACQMKRPHFRERLVPIAKDKSLSLPDPPRES